MKKNHELVVFENGRISLKDLALGETMHSKIGPWEEAQAIYVEQSGLKNRLMMTGAQLVVFDIGLGLAANALAALHCRQSLKDAGHTVRPLRIVSFENDLGGLELALESEARFPFMNGFSEILDELRKKGHWVSEDHQVRWDLWLGDFSGVLENHLGELGNPELIFYDFYSPKSQPSLWRVEFFSALKKISAPRARLVTYSAATSVRVAMMLAGFYVGRGLMTDAKLETTVAAICREDLLKPLGLEWMEKLRRSTKIVPFGISEQERERVLLKVEKILGAL